MIDPVCGMDIELEDAVGSHEYQGETYYFCNSTCLERFSADPEKYLHPPFGQSLVLIAKKSNIQAH